MRFWSGSGAGKTTLLNVLTGIGRPTGEILFNDAPRPKDFIAMCAVIPQEDTLYGALTPRETFTYVARLRLGDKVSLEEKKAAAEAMLEKLELVKCADTPVGNEDIRGISGGEKKRTSIGCELIVNPTILFVDEPTSGLDSKMARGVVEILQKLAHEEGCTVITVIHQPSWRIFNCFDSLVLLKDGRIVFDGGVNDVQSYFSRIGFDAPENENPMDFYFDVLQESKPLDAVEASNDKAGSSPESGNLLPDALFFSEKWLEEKGALKNSKSTENFAGNASDVEAAAAAAAEAASRTSVLSQFTVLTDRCLYDYVKDKTKLGGGIALKLSVGVLFGIIWLNQGRGKMTQGKIFVVEGPIFFCCFSAVFDTLFALIIKYPLTRALIQREYRNRYYQVAPYFFAELLTRSVFESVNALFLGLPCFFLVGMDISSPMQLVVFFAVLSILSTLGAGLGITVGTIAKDVQEAQGLIIPVLMPLMLFSGFFLPYEEIPIFFRWLYEISFLRYAFNILKMNQWQDLDFDDCKIDAALSSVCPVTCYVDGEQYLDETDASQLSMATNFYILLGFLVGMILISFALMYRAIEAKASQG